jgi:hypothetical protein
MMVHVVDDDNNIITDIGFTPLTQSVRTRQHMQTLIFILPCSILSFSDIDDISLFLFSRW